MGQELQRDVHKQQILIDEALKQSVDCIKANAATGAGDCCLTALQVARHMANALADYYYYRKNMTNHFEEQSSEWIEIIFVDVY